jgi:glycosyltransferase involved in cell wall biosynthesis
MPDPNRGDTPCVSIIVPVRNEAEFIERLIEALFSQNYPLGQLEVIVAEGMSTDGTREILTGRCQREYPRLIVVDNPERIVPTGLNRAIEIARGDVIIRIDGHALIAPDFIRQNVELLAEHPEAWSVGGPIRHAARTTFGKAVAAAMSHPLGVGNALHRYPDYEGYAEGAQFPAFRRSVFDRVGLFDERLVRNQDDEFNYRIRGAGGRIYVSPRVRYSYFVRERVRELFKQYFQYGFWRIPVIEKHRRPTTWRHVAPFLFYGACLVLAVVALWRREPGLALILPLVYGCAITFAGALRVRRDGLRVAARIPLAIATIHAAYAMGTAYGAAAKLLRLQAWNVEGRMATLSR